MSLVRKHLVPATLLSLIICGPTSRQAMAEPTVKEALQLAPIQAGIDFDRPSDEETPKCTLKMEKVDGVKGWVVRSSNKGLLRRFVDSNNDNKVDQWCYYKDNVEVYRDIDGDFNTKADQYRWLGSAGSKWGLDKNEDGRVDAWKSISPEELSMAVVDALRLQDANAFRALLLTTSELREIHLSPEKTAQIRDKLGAANAGFAKLAKSQKIVDRDSKWLHFAGHRPGVIPAGHFGLKDDLHVYDNVAVIVEGKKGHHQVHLGTMVRVAQTWKLISLPGNLSEGEVASDGFFFRGSRPEVGFGGQQSPGASEQLQEMIAKLENVDKEIAATSSASAQARLQAKRADVMEVLAESGSNKDRESWIRQFADSVSAAVQGGQYPKGVDRLKTLVSKLTRANADKNVVAYVKFRYLAAEYGQSVQQPNADFPKIQERWLKSLESFVKDFPNSPDAAEAMLQLAIAQEFAGKERDALRWYDRIVSGFPSASHAKKAKGAKRRLQSIGKPLPFKGATSDGKQVDLAAYKGRVVLLHYWATWCGPCKKDLLILKELQAKHGRNGFSLIGVNLDNDQAELTKFMKANRLAWPQLHEAGGLDSRLANELGVITLPTMLLIDKSGRVVNRNVDAVSLDDELKKLLR